MIEFIAEFIAAPEVHLSVQVMHIHVNCHVDTYFRLHDFKERKCPGEHSTRVGILWTHSLKERERKRKRSLCGAFEVSLRKERNERFVRNIISTMMILTWFSNLHDRPIFLRPFTNNNNKDDDINEAKLINQRTKRR